MTILLLVLIALLALAIVAYFELGFIGVAVAFVATWAIGNFGVLGEELNCLALFVPAAIAGLLAVAPIRRALLSSWIFGIYKKILPSMSDTERTALEAGTASWDAELFSGKPDWKELTQYDNPYNLEPEEQKLVDTACNELMELSSKLGGEWDSARMRADIHPELYKALGKHKLFGMIIPKHEGGLGLSARGQTAVLQRLTSTQLNITVGVPNSLGPGELIHNYGTKEQKEFYLPRLASGDEIPCFALTGPRAGSDATSLPDTGVICKGKHPVTGEEVLGFNANFEKRYITLSPIATVVGLAIHLFDPEKHLGDDYDLGITCALIPRNAEGLEIGRRHFPIGAPFMNGPLRGTDVFVPFDWIIGGQDMIGQGWKMLVECLSVGRCMTLPSGAAGSTRVALATSGAYARLRRQFGVPVAEMEGVKHALARIAGNYYMCDAAVRGTTCFVDNGEKPSVPSAILKYHLTEASREVANDAMDIHGGKGICQGPKNYLSWAYSGVPVAITVEGANILTRNLIIFGQGAIRCHPYALAEIEAAGADDLVKFDKSLFSHFGFIFRNVVRSTLLAFTGGLFSKTPFTGPAKTYAKQVNRFSASYAVLVDAAMMSMGGSLKFKELISGRLGDIVSNLYLMSMVIKKYEDGEKLPGEADLMHYTNQTLLTKLEESLDELLENFPNRPLAWILRLIVMPFGRRYSLPDDGLTNSVADSFSNDTPLRDATCAPGWNTGTAESNFMVDYKELLVDAKKAEPIYRKIGRAYKKGQIDAIHLHIEDRVTACEEKGLISSEEAEFMRAFEKRVLAAVHVDDFAFQDIAHDEGLVKMPEIVSAKEPIAFPNNGVYK